MTRSFVLLFTLGMLAACGGANAPEDALTTPSTSANAAPAEPPSIRGLVTAIGDNTIRVEEKPAESYGSAKAIARLTSRTVIMRREGERAAATDLAVGQTVSVWFDGPVMESYPVQSTAGVIVLEP